MKDLGRASIYFSLFSEIAVTLAVPIIAGVLGGWWLDQQVHTLPIFLLVGAMLGLALGGAAVARLITRFLARFE